MPCMEKQERSWTNDDCLTVCVLRGGQKNNQTETDNKMFAMGNINHTAVFAKPHRKGKL